MVLLNTTFHVHPSVDAAFRQWVKEKYLPAAERAGVSLDPVVSRILADSEDGGVNYAVQFKAEKLDVARRWHDTEAHALKESLHRLYGERVLHFTTYMEIL